MAVRAPIVEGSFYPELATQCQQEMDIYLQCVPPHDDLAAPIRAALVPHAGWFYSGQTAAYVYACLQRIPLDTVILFGAVHQWGVEKAGLYGSGYWQTPMGLAEINEDLGRRVIARAKGLIVNHQAAHEHEHAIEVQVPFVQYVAPETLILPIAVPPTGNAHLIGHIVARAVQAMDLDAVAIASSDLTHYGPQYGMAPAGTGRTAVEWTRQNDRLILDLAASMRETEIVDHAQKHRNACGAGALAAAIGYALEFQATKGTLLHYTTSYEARRLGSPSNMVGYGAMVFS